MPHVKLQLLGNILFGPLSLRSFCLQIVFRWLFRATLTLPFLPCVLCHGLFVRIIGPTLAEPILIGGFSGVSWPLGWGFDPLFSSFRLSRPWPFPGSGGCLDSWARLSGQTQFSFLCVSFTGLLRNLRPSLVSEWSFRLGFRAKYADSSLVVYYMRVGGVALGSYHLVSLVWLSLSLSCFHVRGVMAAGFSK